MESTTGSRSHDLKLLKRQKGNEGECIINKLPESIITRILSCLPTKDAVRTSVLSKKWIYRWTSITKLDFDDRLMLLNYPKMKTGGKQNFINFMNRALLLATSSSMESFSLVIANKYDVSFINTWISNILKRSVKSLRIDSHHQLSFSDLTSHFFFNSLLEELEVKVSRCTIKVPTSCAYVGHLKILKLSGIRFTLDSPNNHLSLSLPVLKMFKTTDCTWLSAEGVNLDVPLLESVYIEQLSYLPRNYAIKFSAASLREFTYCGYGYMSQYNILLDPSSAHNASAYITFKHSEIDRVPETGYRASLLLKQFSSAKYLKLEGLEVLAQSNVAVLPVYGMLSHLELGLITGEVLIGFLLKSPSLKTLVFKGISKLDQEHLNSVVVPECLASTLQVVKFGKVHGGEHELCLAKFFMENGLVLERMSFCVTPWEMSSKVLQEFKKKLLSFKEGFSCATVEFSFSLD